MELINVKEKGEKRIGKKEKKIYIVWSIVLNSFFKRIFKMLKIM